MARYAAVKEASEEADRALIILRQVAVIKLRAKLQGKSKLRAKARVQKLRKKRSAQT